MDDLLRSARTMAHRQLLTPIVLIHIATIGLVTLMLFVFRRDGGYPVGLTLAAAFTIFGLLTECVPPPERNAGAATDSGMSITMLFSLCVLLLLWTGHGDYRITTVQPWTKWGMITAGALFCCCGTTMRLCARLALKRNFSYSLRIVRHQELIASGIYRHVRHPAYTGTLFFLIGLVLLTGAYLGFPIFAVAIAVANRRIAHEERLLKEHFGEAHDRYVQDVPKKLFPFIY